MNETQETIHHWCDATFPGADPQSPRRAIRVLEEVVELCLACGASPRDIAATCRKVIHREIPQSEPADWDATAPAPDRIPAEAADALITLYGMAGLRGFDLHAEVDRKMLINRSRRWEPNSDGTGYHVRAGDAP